MKNIRSNIIAAGILCLSLGMTSCTNMGHRTKRFFQWSGKMGERF